MTPPTPTQPRCNPSPRRSLPCIYLANACCLTNKADELAVVLELNHVDIAVISETWFKADTESLGNLAGFNTFARNRSAKDCGGVCILIKDDIPATPLSPDVPQDLEVLWVSARPRWFPRLVSALVVCAVYLPPKSGALVVQELTDHLATTIMLLSKKYVHPLFMIMGDFNPASTQFKAESLTKPCKFKQVVKVPTRGTNTLDFIFTNGSHWYDDPVSLPALGQSDHNAVLWAPLSYQPVRQAPKIRYIRKFPDSRLREFGMWITHHNWDEVFSPSCVDAKVRNFQDTLNERVDYSFPAQKVYQHATDKPWMTGRIKELIKNRQRAHASGDVDLRKLRAKRIAAEIRLAKAKFFKEKITLLHNINPASWFRHISNLTSTQSNDCKLLSIPEVACDIDVAPDVINDHFSNYNNAIPPLDRASLPCFLPHSKPMKTITSLEVYLLLKTLSASKAPGPGDIPLRLMIEFAPELAAPLADIFNCSLAQCVFPTLWKNTHVTPVPKEPVPCSLDQLRPISKTAVPGKVLEKIVVTEIWLHFRRKVDPRQFGNIKGSSTVHYLIELIEQVASNTDVGLAVTAVTIDLKKAFDLIDHTILIRKMLMLDIPGNLVLWTMSFLTGRQQSTQAYGRLSKPHGLTCGVPQGTVLGPLLFLIMVNDDTDNLGHLYKFVDDKTIAVAHSKNSIPALQSSIDKAVEWATTNNMQVNGKKCHAMQFNFSKSQINHNYSINNSLVHCVDELNLLGVIISKDLKWYSNTNFLVTKCNRKFFMFAKLKSFRASREDLLRVWVSYLRPICEYAAPVWHSSISVAESSKIERIQKRAVRIILGGDYNSYSDALESLNIPSMYQRREMLCSKFANNVLSSPKFRYLLPDLRKSGRSLRSANRRKVKEIKCNTTRYYRSAVPYLARLINR